MLLAFLSLEKKKNILEKNATDGSKKRRYITKITKLCQQVNRPSEMFPTLFQLYDGDSSRIHDP